MTLKKFIAAIGKETFAASDARAKEHLKHLVLSGKVVRVGDGRFKMVPTNPAAAALGRLGGSKNTPKQNAARKHNGKLGGRPKKKPL